MAEHKLFQDTRTGKLVEFVSKHDKEFAMVKDAAGNVTFMTLEQLVPYDRDKGRLAKIKTPELTVPEEEAPVAVVPIEDTRLNLNTAPAEQIAKSDCLVLVSQQLKRLSNCVCLLVVKSLQISSS